MECYLCVRSIEEQWGADRKAEAAARRKKEQDSGRLADHDAVEGCGDDQRGQAQVGKRSQAGYQTQYFNFIQDHYPLKFSRFDGYLAALSFWKKMEEFEVLQAYKDYVKRSFRSTDLSVENQNCVPR